VRPGEALEKRCPKCGSTPGTWCPGPNGTFGVHKERIAAARTARREVKNGPVLAPALGRELTPEQIAQVRCRTCRAAPSQPCTTSAQTPAAAFHPLRSRDARTLLYGTRAQQAAAASGPTGTTAARGAGSGGNNPYMPAAESLAGRRPSKGRKRSGFTRQELDEQYRRALEANPGQAGAMRSAGAARGGRGASRRGTGLYS
jgi:hypothetical protein